MATYALRSTVTQVHSDNNHISVTATDNNYLCRAIVFATGFGSALPQQSGMGRISRATIGAQVEVTAVNLKEIEIYLDKSISPDWFAWLVPIQIKKHSSA